MKMPTTNKLRRSQDSQSQPGPNLNVERSSKLSGVDTPTYTAEELVQFLASYENARKYNKYARKLRDFRASDIRGPLFENMWDDIRPGPDVCYDDVYDSLIGKFVPQSGDVETRMYSSGYYNKDGSLNKPLVRRKETLKQLSFVYEYYGDLTVGPPPPLDLDKFALDNPEPTTYMDKYDFSRHFIPGLQAQFDWLDVSIFQNSTPVTPLPTAPPSAAFTTRPTPPPTAPTVAPGTAKPTVAPTTFLRSLRPQAGIEVAMAPPEETTGLTEFVDENPDWEAGILHSKDDSYYAADTNEVGLAEFFSRPIVVKRYDWTSNSLAVLNGIDDIWDLFWSNPRNMNRISNYKNLRANMKVKVLINGSQFHFGRAIVAHKVLGIDDEFFQADNRTTLSQLPKIFLDPSTSQGGVLTLPYLHHYNSYNIPQAEWKNKSAVVLLGMTPLGHIAGNTEKVTITYMVWAEDVVLSCPTTAEPFGMLPQSGDEYGKGIISRPAYAIAHHAGLLKASPYLRPYATATQIASGAIGDVARMFGFARPTNISETVYVKPSLTQTYANIDTTDTIPKLTFDSKQETTVDPRTMGLGPEDSMSFVNVAKREAYLTNFSWNQETSGPGALLFNIGVAPWVYNDVGPLLSLARPLTLPPCAFIAAPFKYWRGTLKYRFQFCSSIMHRGRVRISYDPFQAPLGLPELNTVMNEIVDIGANNDFTIEVGWHSSRSYLTCQRPGVVPAASMYGPNPLPSTVPDLYNGVLYVHVLNELTTPAALPAATNNILVNVFISASDDFEVCDPDATFFETYTFQPQSGVEEVVSDSSSPCSAPTIRVFGNNCQPNHSLIYHGDPIVSIRSALKRYTFYRRLVSGVITIAGPWIWVLQQCSFPRHKGKGPGGHLAGINYVHLTPLTYYTPAFMGYRGGIRHKMHIMNSNINSSLTASVSRAPRSPTETNFLTPLTVMTATGALYNSATFLTNKATGWSGSAVSNMAISPIIEAEIPYCGDRRYYNARTKDHSLMSQQFHKVEVSAALLPTNSHLIVDDFVSAADDFSLFFFVGLPTIYSGILA